MADTSLLVAKITFVVAEISFQLSVVITFNVCQIDFASGSTSFEDGKWWSIRIEYLAYFQMVIGI